MIMGEFEESKTTVVVEISKCIRMGSIGMGNRLACIGIGRGRNDVLCMGMCINGFGKVVLH